MDFDGDFMVIWWNIQLILHVGSVRVDGLMEISSHYNENVVDMTVYNLICVTIKLGVFYYDKLGFSVYNRYIQGEDGKVIQYKIPKMLGWVGFCWDGWGVLAWYTVILPTVRVVQT